MAELKVTIRQPHQMMWTEDHQARLYFARCSCRWIHTNRDPGICSIEGHRHLQDAHPERELAFRLVDAGG